MTTLSGIGVGRGVAVGSVRRMADPLPEPPTTSSTLGPDAEKERVTHALAATAEDIMKSYAATVDSLPAAKWLLANGAHNPKNGKVEYDWREARKAFPDRDNGHGGSNQSYEEGEIAHMAKVAAGLIADLAAARDAKDNEVRSVALAKAFGGLGESGLPYDEAVRVFRRGAALQAWCEARLESIRATIEELTADGRPAGAPEDAS